MQPDHSYLITADRLTIFSPSEKNKAHETAQSLCPNGYATDTEFQNAFKEYTLIVKCQNSSRLPAAD